MTQCYHHPNRLAVGCAHIVLRSPRPSTHVSKGALTLCHECFMAALQATDAQATAHLALHPPKAP